MLVAVSPVSLSGRLYLGTLHHALDEQIIHDLQVSHTDTRSVL